MTSIPHYYVSSDAAWVENVDALIQKARCVVMDISQYTSSIGTELRLIAERRISHRTVFVARRGLDVSFLKRRLAADGVDPDAVCGALCLYDTSWWATIIRAVVITAATLFIALITLIIVRDFGPTVCATSLVFLATVGKAIEADKVNVTGNGNSE